jgi:hypothetical protein
MFDSREFELNMPPPGAGREHVGGLVGGNVSQIENATWSNFPWKPLKMKRASKEMAQSTASI